MLGVGVSNIHQSAVGVPLAGLLPHPNPTLPVPVPPRLVSIAREATTGCNTLFQEASKEGWNEALSSLKGKRLKLLAELREAENEGSDDEDDDEDDDDDDDEAEGRRGAVKRTPKRSRTDVSTNNGGQTARLKFPPPPVLKQQRENSFMAQLQFYQVWDDGVYL